ncbi:hypothetical protein FKW77_000273 [Venturia effusa]|uniref:Uncharacterized protein n=1 Tax=Venturia effusa TaxID=50376 RepID=A0A517LBS4_9PEZI|nr:hypothetical protein FKW77_000273 [Venturia effusa]
MAFAQDPSADRLKETMRHGSATHTVTPAASIAVRRRLKWQNPAKSEALMWPDAASHASLPLPQFDRRSLGDSKAKKAMWHDSAPFDLAATSTAFFMLRKRETPADTRPKASMWHGPLPNTPLDLSSPITGAVTRSSPSPLDMKPLAGLKPIPGLASPAAPLPVSPFEPTHNTAKLKETMPANSAASTHTSSLS